jgi:hypothetical protein
MWTVKGSKQKGPLCLWEVQLQQDQLLCGFVPYMQDGECLCLSLEHISHFTTATAHRLARA